MKIAMVRTHRYIQGVNEEVRMLLTVHDELVFEIKEDKLDTHIPELMNIMSLHDLLSNPPYNWAVPLSMDCEVGDSWDVEYEYFKENPQEIRKLIPVLRDMKIKSLELNPETLEPLKAEPKVEKTVESTVETKVEVVQEASLDLDSDDPVSVALQAFRSELPQTVDTEMAMTLMQSFRKGLSKFMEVAPLKPQEEPGYLNGMELQTERLKLPLAWKKYIYTIQSPVLTDEKAHLLQFILKICAGGSNPFILKDRSGEILVKDRTVDAIKFEILATHYNI